MKLLLSGIAAAVLATGAMAQTTTQTTPGQTMPGQTMPTNPSPASSGTMTPDAGAPAASSGVPLEQRDGKWWNGDRHATKQEIKDWEQAQKAMAPR
ncbi:MAG: hypothetical protein RL490_706 [Pseudomonadota bacterium]|jgi:hypothetical protein